MQSELADDGSASVSETLQAQMSVWQRFYQTCLQYQKSVSTPLGLTQQSNDAVCLVKKVSLQLNTKDLPPIIGY